MAPREANARLDVAVTPRAAADRVGPLRDGVLLVRVTRPPADGEANRVVIRLVARALGLPPTSVALVSGAGSRRKRLSVAGLSADELALRLASFGGPGGAAD
jgi:uncharacterized protein YggU (UPF0235/DUF167 family)